MPYSSHREFHACENDEKSNSERTIINACNIIACATQKTCRIFLYFQLEYLIRNESNVSVLHHVRAECENLGQILVISDRILQLYLSHFFSLFIPLSNHLLHVLHQTTHSHPCLVQFTLHWDQFTWHINETGLVHVALVLHKSNSIHFIHYIQTQGANIWICFTFQMNHFTWLSEWRNSIANWALWCSADISELFIVSKINGE